MSPADVCINCHGSKRVIVRVNRGRRAEVPCPTCSGTGEAAEDSRREPPPRELELVPGTTVAAAAAKLLQPALGPVALPDFTPEEIGQIAASAALTEADRNLAPSAPPAHEGQDFTAPPPGEPAPPATSRKRRRKKPTSAPAIARRRRQPMAPELPGIPDHHDVPWCGCDRCWNGDA